MHRKASTGTFIAGLFITAKNNYIPISRRIYTQIMMYLYNEMQNGTTDIVNMDDSQEHHVE